MGGIALESFSRGQLVCSRAGRDKGSWYVVVGSEGDDRLLVADGKQRQAINPKRKNRKHLQPANLVIKEIKECLDAGRLPTNSQLRRAIAQFIKGEGFWDIGREEAGPDG